MMSFFLKIWMILSMVALLTLWLLGLLKFY